jgi:hypothetical protein
MASELKVNKITPESGVTLTLGDLGDTITIPSGATLTNNGTASGFGKVLQVVNATDSTQRSTTSTSFVTASNTLSVSITPSSVSNKIFVICTVTFGNNTQGQSAKATIFRDATNLGATNGIMNSFSDTGSIREQGCMTILDSPNTTSSITYQAYFSVSANQCDLNWNSTKGSITAFEIEG